jgi:SAM-dependent methyltransferase
MENNFNSLDFYVNEFPKDENALKLFQAEWSSILPGFNPDLCGASPLFDDPRMSFWVSSIHRRFPNSVANPTAFRVLELGPLEGGHTYQLVKHSWDITSIESNSRAFLKCLISANIYGMRAKFLLGDFEPYLASPATENSFDFVLASGVLYHLQRPVSALQSILKCTKSVGIWTHYMSPDYLAANPDRWEWVEYPDDYSERTIPGYRQRYNIALQSKSFCGGSKSSSVWMTKDQILQVLTDHGFSYEVSSIDESSPSGPSLILFAYKP